MKKVVKSYFKKQRTQQLESTFSPKDGLKKEHEERRKKHIVWN